MKKLLPIFIIAILVVGASSFYSGMKYGQSTYQNFDRRDLVGQQFGPNTNRGSRSGFGNNRAGGGFINGEIISKDAQSITVQLRNASSSESVSGSKIIFLSNSTLITKSTNGSFDDLQIGSQVLVNGAQNADGTITASNIQIGR